MTDKHQTKRTGVAHEFLTLYQAEGEDLFKHIIMGVECWVHYCTPETKAQSKEWLPVGGKPPKKFKREHSTGKIFGDCLLAYRGCPS